MSLTDGLTKKRRMNSSTGESWKENEMLPGKMWPMPQSAELIMLLWCNVVL